MAHTFATSSMVEVKAYLADGMSPCGNFGTGAHGTRKAQRSDVQAAAERLLPNAVSIDVIRDMLCSREPHRIHENAESAVTRRPHP